MQDVFFVVLGDAELSTKPARDLLAVARESLGPAIVYATARRARAVAKKAALEKAFAMSGSLAEHIAGTYGAGTV